jgi:hypothetical protein
MPALRAGMKIAQRMAKLDRSWAVSQGRQDGRMSEDLNPYSAPQFEGRPEPASGRRPLSSPYEPAIPRTAEELRRDHLGHEGALLALGTIYLLLGGLVLAASLLGPWLAGVEWAIRLGTGAVFVPVAMFLMWVGHGLRRLDPEILVPAAAASIAGLLISLFSLPTLCCGGPIEVYFTYLVVSAKGAYVLSDRYRMVVAATPHLKAYTPVFMWAVVCLIGAAAVMGTLVLALPEK